MTLLTVGLTLIAAAGSAYVYLLARNAYVPPHRLPDHGRPVLPTSDALPSRGGLVDFRLLSDLRQAIGRHALTVLYQPKVDLRSTDVVGAEALVRWPHPFSDWCAPTSSCRWCASTA